MRSLLFMLLALSVTVMSPAEVVDRVVASVNNRPVLWTDIGQEARFEALFNGRPISTIDADQRRAVLTRLIDHMLLDQEIQQSGITIDAALEQRHIDEGIQKIRELHHVLTDDDWARLLKQYNLTQDELLERLRLHIRLQDFIDVRFRAGVSISQQQIEQYYQTEFTQAMRQKHAQLPPLANVRGQIESILLQQAISSSVTTWLDVVRAQADVWELPELASPKTSEAH